MSALDSETTYQVVLNLEEQYSIWQEGSALPPGWRTAGFSGPKEACLTFIEETWTDMRPASLRG